MDLDQFQNQVVFGWIKKDIERITTELPARSGEMGNVNFPLALCVLEYLQYLGSFLLGKDCGATQNMKAYISKCLPNSAEYSEDLLADIFRNGLAHDYFARGGVSRDGLRPAVYSATIGPILDIETLVQDFLNSLPKFRTELSEKNFNERMSQVLTTISTLQTKHKAIIDKLPTGQKPRINPINGNQIITSGISGTNGPVTFT